jgi:ceramide glucosyltransferase
MQQIVGVAGVLVTAVAAVYSTFTAFLLLRWRPIATEQRRPAGRALAGVSILKPLCGAEPHLLDCLRSFAGLEYPQLQIVFGVRDADDPAIAAVHQLRAEFPDLDIVLVVDSRVHGANLKVSNLINMLPQARHPVIIISDSDVMVGADYLDSVLRALAPADVGLVTCLYQGRPGPGLWARVAALLVNDWFFPAVLVSRALGDPSFCSGVTIALRRSTIDNFGGFEAAADHVADDWLVGEKVRGLGLKTELASCTVQTEFAEEGFRPHALRELRWARTIRTIRPASYAFMGVTLGFPVALIGAGMTLASDRPASVLAGQAFALAAWTLVCRVVIHWVQCRRAGGGLGYDLPLILLRDGLLLVVWVAGFFGRTITWRGRRYWVRSDGALSVRNG